MREPKEKADELMKKTVCLINGWNYQWAEGKTIEAIKKDGLMNTSWWRTKETVLFYVDEILSNIPMYTGNLNPKWAFWNEVKKNVQEL